MAVALTRADRILAALVAELERRRSIIDAEPGLRRVEFIIKLDQRNGQPVCLLYRSEAESPA